MNIIKIILISLIAMASVTAKEESEKPSSSQTISDSESWTPVEGAKKVGSGVMIEWVVPEDGTLFYGESTKRICFVTKSVKKGDVYTTFDESGPDKQLGEVISQSILGVDDEEVFSSLRFNLFFQPLGK
jgi:hypothetical protein